MRDPSGTGTKMVEIGPEVPYPPDSEFKCVPCEAGMFFRDVVIERKHKDLVETDSSLQNRHAGVDTWFGTAQVGS